MSTFNDVFNKSEIYNMFFFNVKAVLEYSTLAELKENNEPMYNNWKHTSKIKYGCDIESTDEKEANEVYVNHAVYIPEYCKIVAITYATLYLEDGQIKRYFKKIVDKEETIVLETFIDVLKQISSDSAQSTPQEFPILCGHNIVNYDIPLLIKRFLKLVSKFQTIKQLPFILKRSLELKPWESGILDTTTIWKFNGHEGASLMQISDYLGLKRTVDLIKLPELSKYYNESDDDIDDKLKHIALQSATQTNLTIQLVNNLRYL